MTTQTLKCPVCGKPLTQNEYDKALGLWEEKQQHIHHLEAERRKLREQQKQSRQQLLEERRKLKRQEQSYKRKETRLAQTFRQQQKKLRAQAKRELARQAQKTQQRYERRLERQRTQIEKSLARDMEVQIKAGIEKGIAQQKSQIKKQSIELRKSQSKLAQLEKSLKLSAEKYDKANAEIKRLREQIEKGITPQIEGLLEEDVLLAKLQQLFPKDRFSHPGKGGDIIQTVIEQGNEIGIIVYECKKVKNFDKKHIAQAQEARRVRNADFAILVTNAFPSKKQYYFVERTVFVISPVSLEPIAHTLRDSLVKIAILRLSNEAKAKAVQQVYDYLSSNEYSNKMNDVATQLLDLGKDLKTEVDNHKRIWVKRYRAYQSLFNDIGAIDYKLRGLVQNLPGVKPLLLPEPKRPFPEIEDLQTQR